MKPTRHLMSVLAATAAIFTADSAMAAERHRTRIVLQVTDYSELRPDVLAGARSEVTTIYARIGVDVIWTAPDGREGHAPNFTVVILSPEMGLKMIATEGVGPNVMGHALKGAKRAYIFAHRVSAVSVTQLIDFQRLLGKVIAHEVGHLLQIEHSQFGIMKPRLQVRTNASEWFTPIQGTTIRAELAGAAN